MAVAALVAEKWACVMRAHAILEAASWRRTLTPDEDFTFKALHRRAEWCDQQIAAQRAQDELMRLAGVPLDA